MNYSFRKNVRKIAPKQYVPGDESIPSFGMQAGIECSPEQVRKILTQTRAEDEARRRRYVAELIKTNPNFGEELVLEPNIDALEQQFGDASEIQKRVIATVIDACAKLSEVDAAA